MKPIEVSVQLQRPVPDVYEFLAVSANHQRFTDHMLTEWSFDGPPRGVGSVIHAVAVMGNRREQVDIEVIEDVPPTRIVERNVGADGKRIATGTYTIAATDGGTTVTFTYAWQSAPLVERLLAPVVRKVMRGVLETSMSRLADELA